jgi:blocked early in transport 1
MNGTFSAYPGASNGDAGSRTSGDGGFRSATPDRKGRYADSVYNELESQNDEQVGVMTEKVKMLKSVSWLDGTQMTNARLLMIP